MRSPIRRFWVRLHRWLGALLACVLVCIGVTGASMAFEDELLWILNRRALTVDAGGAMHLSVPELLARVREQLPTHRVQSLELHRGPDHAAIVRTFEGHSGDPVNVARDPRGAVSWLLDPVTGRLLRGRELRGEAAFRWIRSLHRWLAFDAWGARSIGRRIVSLAAIGLVVLMVSGLVLHPVAGWRRRLVPRLGRGRRARLWNLHGWLGTLAAPILLWFVATGLYWSFDGYRERLDAWAGIERRGPTSPTRGGSSGRASGSPASLGVPLDLDRAWGAARSELIAAGVVWSQLTLRLPDQDRSELQIRYLEQGAPHSRAFSTLRVDGITGEIASHDRHGKRSFAGRLVSSMLALHSGSYFGVVGQLIAMLGSVSLVGIVVTGVWLLVGRYRRRSDARPSRATRGRAADPAFAVPGPRAGLEVAAAGQLHIAQGAHALQPSIRTGENA